MDLIFWLLSTIGTATLVLVVLWLSRNLITTRLTKSVEHEFNAKLESIRAEIHKNEELFKTDLRSKEAEIAALRGGAMTAMASRQVALDKRRLEAVDQLWSAFTALGPARATVSFMTAVQFEKAAEMAVTNANVRQMFKKMGDAFNPNTPGLTDSAKARPFVSPMAWAVFSAYQAIAMQAVLKVQIIMAGIGAKDYVNKDAIAKLVKAALPHHVTYIDTVGEAGYHYFLEELEGMLLDELRKMLAGVETDKATVAQAAEILKLSTELSDSVRQKGSAS